VLKLTPRNGESINDTSAFLDLNQVYGSVESHGIFMREYKGNGELTGRLPPIHKTPPPAGLT
jgi:hypothetical protein